MKTNLIMCHDKYSKENVSFEKVIFIWNIGEAEKQMRKVRSSCINDAFTNSAVPLLTSLRQVRQAFGHREKTVSDFLLRIEPTSRLEEVKRVSKDNEEFCKRAHSTTKKFHKMKAFW